MLMVIALALAGGSAAPSPEECPGPLAGRWRESVYECGLVRRADPYGSVVGEDGMIEEWAATYQLAGYRRGGFPAAVEVLFDGRYRRYPSGTPAPEWRRGAASKRQLFLYDACAAGTTIIWPPRVYRATGGCVTPFDAYAWTPTGPDDAVMSRALYSGTVKDGIVTLDLDPYPHIYSQGTPVVMAEPRPDGAFRAVAHEGHRLVDGRRRLVIDEWIDAGRARYPIAPADIVRGNLALGDERRRVRDFGDEHGFYWRAMLVLRERIPEAEGARRSALETGYARCEAIHASLLREMSKGGAWRPLMDDLSSCLHGLVDAFDPDPAARKVGFVRTASPEADRVARALPTVDGRLEAELIRWVPADPE